VKNLYKKQQETCGKILTENAKNLSQRKRGVKKTLQNLTTKNRDNRARKLTFINA